MATHHAAPGEVVNLAHWADDLPQEHSKAIAKTDEMELARLSLKEGDSIANHHVDGPLVVHCLRGCLELRAMKRSSRLEEGELLYLPPKEQFTLAAARDSLALLTFVFARKQQG